MKIPFTLSCKAATALMEKKYTSGLTFREKLQLWMHTALCDACRRYEKQSLYIEQLLNKYLGKNKESDAMPPRQSDDLEAKILQKLKER